MIETNKSDPAPEIAWTIVKVIFNLVRFFIGAFCTLAFFGALFALNNQYPGALALGLWHALIFGILAFFIWPQRYGPPTKLIELFQNQRTNKAN